MKKLSLAVLLLVAATVLGATVLREPVADAATATLNVFVTNDSAHPVPVHEQGTAQVSVANTPLPVSAGYETQKILDQVLSDGDRVTIPVAAYREVHVDFDLENGFCFGSGASLLVVEGETFLRRLDISAAEACVGGFTGKTIEIPGRSLTFIVSAPGTDTWRVVAFGRAN